MLYRVSPVLKSAYFCAEIGEKVFKNGYHGYKNIDTLYLSKGARWAYSYIFSQIGIHITFHFAPKHLTSGDLEGQKRSYSLNLQKTPAFSQLVFD